MDQVTVDKAYPPHATPEVPLGLVPWGMRCGHHFGDSHRLGVISGHHCLDHSLIRVAVTGDLLLSATSVVIKPRRNWN